MAYLYITVENDDTKYCYNVDIEEHFRGTFQEFYWQVKDWFLPKQLQRNVNRLLLL